MATYETILERDVVVLGGGSTGSFAAIALKDLGKSVVIIEKRDQLGGHTNTYADSATGKAVNFGVQIYHNTSVVRRFHQRLGITVAPLPRPTIKPLYVDFSKPVIVDNYTVSMVGSDYTDRLRKYPYLEDGFHLPDDVPEDLLLPWSEYATKYNIDQSQHAIFQAPGSPGDPSKRLAVYVFNFVNSLVLSAMKGDIVRNVNGDNSELFRNAHAEIGTENVLLSSTVTSATRSPSGIKLVVSTVEGEQTIYAKQLIVAAPPQASNLEPLGLDSREQRILSQVEGCPFYTGVITSTGLPSQFSYYGVGADAYYQAIQPPSVAYIMPSPAAPGHFFYGYTSLEPLGQSEVEARVMKSIRGLQTLLIANGSDTTAEPQFRAFADNTPFHMELSAESIRGGFYKEMDTLQGYRNTWYIGALSAITSSQLWSNTEAMLPRILSAI